MISRVSYVTFSSIHHLLLAEELLRERDYRVEVSPLPPGVDSFCTKALLFPAAHEAEIREILARNNVAVEKFHKVSGRKSVRLRPDERLLVHTARSASRKPVYLNNAATSFPKPASVYQAVLESFKSGCSPQRSEELTGDRTVYNTRKSLACLFNADSCYQVIFTFNATEGLNLALLGLLKQGDHVITSSLEHNSVIRPLLHLKERGVSFTRVVADAQGRINLKEVESNIRKNTKLFVFTHASNVTGTVLPVAEIGEIARKRHILFLLDAAQTAGACPIDLTDLHVDMLAFAGHKSLFGLSGTGGLIIKKDIRLTPLKFGGTGSQTKSGTQPEVLPDKYESGTLNLPGIISLSKGVEFIRKEGLPKIQAKESLLTGKLFSGLSKIKNVVLYGPPEPSNRMPVVSFNLRGFSPSEVAALLEKRYRIVSRPGLHCSPWAHQTINTYPTGTIRLSPGYFNTRQEIDYAVDSIRELSRLI